MARTKYSVRFCGYCNKDARMEMMGEAQGSQEKLWFRCTRCHHMSLIEMAPQSTSQKAAKLDPASATVYSPVLSFKIGDSIFHNEWNDVGKVINKVKTSDGSQAIIVSFEKAGQRRLIENLKPEPANDLANVNEVIS